MKSSLLPDEHRGVTFEKFASAILRPDTKPIWQELLDSLRDAAPTSCWDNVRESLPSVIVNFAWAAAIERRPYNREARGRARKLVADLDRLEKSWANLRTVVSPTQLSSVNDLDLEPARIVAALVTGTGIDRGGPDRTPQFEYLLALCSRLHDSVTATLPPTTRWKSFIRLANFVTQLVRSTQGELGVELIRLPKTAAAWDKRLARFAERRT